MNTDHPEQNSPHVFTSEEILQFERQSQEYNQCKEAVKRLNEYLSKELTTDEAADIQQHLGECQGCLARFTFEENLIQTIRQRAQQVVAPANLRDKILSLLHREPSSSSEAPISQG
jgi:anti-sigma factor (TIGR02949 family)